jgi:hypothetical protein
VRPRGHRGRLRPSRDGDDRPSLVRRAPARGLAAAPRPPGRRRPCVVPPGPAPGARGGPERSLPRPRHRSEPHRRHRADGHPGRPRAAAAARLGALRPRRDASPAPSTTPVPAGRGPSSGIRISRWEPGDAPRAPPREKEVADAHPRSSRRPRRPGRLRGRTAAGPPTSPSTVSTPSRRCRRGRGPGLSVSSPGIPAGGRRLRALALPGRAGTPGPAGPSRRACGPPAA